MRNPMIPCCYPPVPSRSVPPIGGLPCDKVFTLRNIPDTVRIKEFVEEEFPDTAIVIGGGYIGVEMAENLKKQG